MNFSFRFFKLDLHFGTSQNDLLDHQYGPMGVLAIAYPSGTSKSIHPSLDNPVFRPYCTIQYD